LSQLLIQYTNISSTNFIPISVQNPFYPRYVFQQARSGIHLWMNVNRTQNTNFTIKLYLRFLATTNQV